MSLRHGIRASTARRGCVPAGGRHALQKKKLLQGTLRVPCRRQTRPSQPIFCMSRAIELGLRVETWARGREGRDGATRRCHGSEAHLIKNQARALARSDAGKAGVHGSTQTHFLVGQLVISGRSMPGLRLRLAG